MNEISNNKLDSLDMYRINFNSILQILLNNKIKISSITLFFTLVSLIYSISLPNIYQAKTILAPSSNSSGNFSNIASQYSGFASLAGISIPRAGETNKVAMGIEVLQSFNFYETFIKKNNLYVELLATKKWDKASNSLIINSELYDKETKMWLDKSEFAINGMPSLQSAHETFLSKLIIEVDTKTGFISIYFSHVSPYVAKKVIDLLISEINYKTKQEDISLANNSIKYLENELSKTKISSTISSINSIIEKQLEIIAFANATPEYLLKTLSPPIVPENKISPKRGLILILGMIMGFLLSIAYLCIPQKTNFINKQEQRFDNKTDS